jgi:hypothetical protein
MFIAHAPSGYLLATAMIRKLGASHVAAATVIFATIAGALVPDLDMFYYYLVDHGKVHHHRYVTHWPIVWIGLSAGCALWLRFASDKKHALLALMFCFGAVMHMVLDTMVGDIWWFAPFVDKPYALFTVPSLFQPWWLNFILHWSFAVELVLLVWALLVYRKRSA